jgi:hypothetical protein
LGNVGGIGHGLGASLAVAVASALRWGGRSSTSTAIRCVFAAVDTRIGDCEMEAGRPETVLANEEKAIVKHLRC